MLLATSCLNEKLDPANSDNEAQVTFSLTTEGNLATKAISDGEGADKLVYAVFNETGDPLSVFEDANGVYHHQKVETLTNEIVGEESAHDVVIRLAKGQTYQVAFWAQDSDCDAYNTDDLRAVVVDYNAAQNNDETRDAFFKTVTISVTRNEVVPVILKRPFAQINVGVTEEDWKAAIASDIEILNSKVVIKKAANKINLLNGDVDGEVEVIYDFAKIPHQFNPSETLTVDIDGSGTIADTEKFYYLSMSYILTSADKSTLESLKYTFDPETGNDIVLQEGLTQVPVQRNWRTNIIGEILTGEIKFNVYIDQKFDGDFNGDYDSDGTIGWDEIHDGVSYNAATKTFMLSSWEGFKWFALQADGKTRAAEAYDTANGTFRGYTVKLATDIDMTAEEGNSYEWTPIDLDANTSQESNVNAFAGTFDGCNHTIKNVKMKTTEKHNGFGLFAVVAGGTIKNLNLENITVNAHYKAGALIGHANCATIDNCHVDGANITITPLNKDRGNHAGGLIGFAEYATKIQNSSVKNVNVTAYRDLGGLVGTISGDGAVIKNNSLDNVVVVADQMAEYGSEEPANCGEIVGCDAATSKEISSNSVNNVNAREFAVVNGTVSVASDSEFDLAITNANSYGVNTIQMGEGTYTTTTIPAGVKFVGVGDNSVLDVKDATPAVNGDVNIENAKVVHSNANYTGFQHTADSYYKGVTIEGQPFLYGNKIVFEDCTFIQTSSDAYNVWTYDAKDVTFKNCTFNSAGKAILVYHENLESYNRVVTFEDCDINASSTVDGKAAIEIDSSSPNDLNASGKYTINIDSKTTATGFSTNTKSGNSLWNQKKGDKAEVYVDGVRVVTNAEELSAVAKYASADISAKFYNDIAGDATLIQKENVKIFIDGNKYSYDGSIIIDGKSARYETAGVTIQNVNFTGDSNSADAYINLGKEGDNNTRYTNHVTVKDCTFSTNSDTDVVAIKSYTGGDYNLNLIGCTVNESMHSFVQVTNIEKGLKFNGCKVYSKNGINLNNTPTFDLDGCTFDTKGYAIRVGVNGSINTDKKTFNVSNSTLKSACDDGDAVIIFRDNATYAEMTLTKTTIEGTTKYSGNTTQTTIVEN